MNRTGKEIMLPMMALRGISIFPGTVIPLQVGRKKSLEAIEMAKDKLIFLTTQKNVEDDEPTVQDVYDVGTIAEIKQITKDANGTAKIVIEGIARGNIVEHVQEDPYFQVRVEELEEYIADKEDTDVLVESLIEQYESYVKLSKRMPANALVTVVNVEEPGKLADNIAAHILQKPEDKQEILEAIEVNDRLEKVYAILSREMELLELEKRLTQRVRQQMEKTQREYYLREQMKAIQKELGEGDDKYNEVEELKNKIEGKNLPEEVKEKALKELTRLEKMPPMAAEAVVVRNYLDWLLALPWNEETEDSLDLFRSQQVLDEDHYGLEKVKERILEHLAVRQMVSKVKGPIICLVGPPGVGKTSLAKSIARAMNRKFVRVSLGGVRDEAEIRGHRRTYVGAMPGRIIQGMKQAKSQNPVFLLDEIDKMSSDFRGDPASALLEVLDPEQNNTFSDHYLETSYDLSKVMFITTANTLYSIPRPLLDRMEVIHIPGYTEEEKIEIAQGYLMPKVREAHGLDSSKVKMSETALRKCIREYTREAGVRNLERELSNICRKVTKHIVQGDRDRANITVKNIEEYLGKPRYRYGSKEEENQVGVVTGLGWTETGGDIMPIEVSILQGKGNLLLTGKLGDVMKESAQAAFSYVRSRAFELQLPEDFYQKIDVHVHVPEGAVPKDGPSAGISMATALASALTRIPVRHDVAMTGEVTLRGRVLPIGGVKEKILAAHRSGIETIILPEENEKDLADVPQNVAKKMKFILVKHMDEVLEKALVVPPSRLPEKNLASLVDLKQMQDLPWENTANQ